MQKIQKYIWLLKILFYIYIFIYLFASTKVEMEQNKLGLETNRSARCLAVLLNSQPIVSIQEEAGAQQVKAPNWDVTLNESPGRIMNGGVSNDNYSDYVR